jgi:predicted secreted protein with PEFG-CTERM motif
MKIRSASSYFSYALILTLVGSIFSTVVPVQPSYSSHTNLEIEIDDIEFGQGDDAVIRGTNEDGNDGDNVDITIHLPGTGSDSETADLDEDGKFSEVYSIPNEDGLYQVEVEFAGEADHVFGFFFVDDDDNVVDVSTDEDVYEPGQTVTIDGEVNDPVPGVEEVEITVFDPTGDEFVTSADVDLDSSDRFDYDFDLDDEFHGTYGILVEYDNEDAGSFVFIVEEDGGSSTTTITASLSDTSVEPGDTVTVTGSIDDNDVDPAEEVELDVEDPAGDEFFTDSVDPETDGTFEFDIDLDDNADEGQYRVTLSYTGYGDKVLTFTVSEGTTGGGTNTGSGSSGGLTARINKVTFAAGEMMTITGVVPRIVTDETINIVVLAPNGAFTGSAVYPEPDSDKSYSTSLRLKSTVEEDDDYQVVISYDDNEVTLKFDITGTSDGASGGPITIETDKDSYSTGSTVKISGEIADDIFVDGKNVLIRVFNSEDKAYRFDQVEPSSDGSYSYSMVVGGVLGVSGEWEVIASFEGEEAKTTFDLTGGAEPKPGYSLVVEDETYRIEYEVSDGEVKSMYVKPSEKKLVILILTQEPGTLTIVLPREVIDAVEAGKDVNYVVSLFDLETGSEKTVNLLGTLSAEARTLTIEYEAGTDLIEILGTTVVPEFGPIAGIILAVAVVGIIATTARFSGKFSTSREL